MAEKSKFFARLQGDHRALAEIAEAEGAHREAAEAWVRAGEPVRALQVAVASGDRKLAVEIALTAALGKIPPEYRGADAAQAGELLEASGHLAEALPLFEMAGDYPRAASAAVKLAQGPRAARLYEKGRRFALAAVYYERAGLARDAVRCLDLEIKRLEGQGVRTREADASLHQVSLKRAELLAKLGRRDEAMAALDRAEPSAGAADLLAKGGRIRDAIENYLASGRRAEALALVPRLEPEEGRFAAETLRRCGRPDAAADRYAALGLAREAAEAYAAASRWPEAAAQWEKAGDRANAADAYQRSGRHREAGRLFAALGRHTEAAAALERAGDHTGAGRAHLQAGRFVEAATHLLKVGDLATAHTALRQIPAGDPAYGWASVTLAPTLIRSGAPREAFDRLERIRPAAGAVDPVEVAYWKGRALEALDDGRGATALFATVVERRPAFRDAAGRLDTLTRALGPALAANPPAPPAAPRAGGEPPPLDLAPGFLLAGRWEILGELGRGGMGRVYRARDRELDETVAIKTLLPGERTAAEEDRMLREVQICRKITHPNVVRIFDLGRYGGTIFISMEYLEGRSLEELIDPDEPPPLAQVRWLLDEAAAGLEEAHRLGVVHRDLKPANLLLTASRLKILDFGIARMDGAGAKLTRTGLAIGTPMYMSPEQTQGQPVGPASDLYSLGIVGYALVTGKEPFTGASIGEIVLRQLREPHADPRRLRPGLDRAWSALFDRCLAKEPEARHPSATALRAALAALPV